MSHVNRSVEGRCTTFIRLARATIVLVVLTGSIGCSQHRIPDGPPLQIHRKFAGGHKFTYNSPAEQPVWDWFSLDPAFAATLERHPTALDQAQKATTPHTASQILAVASTLYSIKILLSQETDAYGFTYWPDPERDLAIAGALLVGGLVFNRVAQSQLNRAVSLFNAAETGSAREDAARQDLFERLQFSPIYQPGEGVGLLARLPLR